MKMIELPSDFVIGTIPREYTLEVSEEDWGYIEDMVDKGYRKISINCELFPYVYCSSLGDEIGTRIESLDGNNYYDLYYKRDVDIDKMAREGCHMIWKFIRKNKEKEIINEIRTFLINASINDDFVLHNEKDDYYFVNINVLVMSKMGYFARKGYLNSKEFEFFNYKICTP